MPDATSLTVSVIITAWNAAATIGDAVASALAQPEVAEVIVVDDASADRTVAAARAAAAGDARLVVIESAVNIGPAAARNLAIDRATGDGVALLDADDFLLPGRFARMLALPDWDMVADNILFVAEATGPDGVTAPAAVDGIVDLGLADFVLANRSQRGASRKEWGFLKPLMRRDFLLRHGLHYDPALRLGEDYDLYVRMLQKGARFRVLRQVGYVARWREGSLSSRHRTEDLQALAEAARGHLSGPLVDGTARAALVQHHSDLRRRFLLRQFLDHRQRDGRMRAMLGLLARPGALMPVVGGVLRDKLTRGGSQQPPSRIGRMLIED